MAEWIDPVYRETVKYTNNYELGLPTPRKVLIVEGVRRFPDVTVLRIGREHFRLPTPAVELVLAGDRVVLDEAVQENRAILPFGERNQPLCRIPVLS